MKKKTESHDNIVDSRVSSTNYDDNESENIRGESIGGAALIKFVCPRCGAYSSKYGICSCSPHNCKIGHFTSWKERGRLRDVPKIVKCTCKACKTIVFYCQICKFATFLSMLPS